ncbi:MAG: signal peptidase II [Planctomycetaceae bacterium]|jgi:signal peptidase II|nr:signal peptidase II [Planctomycetaceae bacterium]
MKNLREIQNKNDSPLHTNPVNKNHSEQQIPYSIFSFVFVFRILLFLAIAGIGVVADLETKKRVFQTIGMPGMYRLIEEPELAGIYWLRRDVLGFQTSLNQGALFGMGQGQIFWLTLFSFIFLIGIVVWILYSAWKSQFLIITLGLIVAGIIGNLYDRLGLHGLCWNNGEPIYAVRDWILVMLGSYPWPNFNIADSMLVCGAILLALHSFFINDHATSDKQIAEKTKHENCR